MATLNVTVSSGGNRLEGAKVVLTRNNNRIIEHTRGDGVARFTNITAANYSLRVTKPYYTIRTDTVGVSGTTTRDYTLSRLSGDTVTRSVGNDGIADFSPQASGDYYIFSEGGVWEEIVDQQTLDSDDLTPTYYVRQVRNEVRIRVDDDSGSDLEGAIVQLGSQIRITDRAGQAQFMTYNGTLPLTVSHPSYEIHHEELEIEGSMTRTVGLTTPDPDDNAPPNDATLISHAKIEDGESIEVVVEESTNMTDSYDLSQTVELSDGYNEIPLSIDGGNSRYRWSATLSSDSYDTSPQLFEASIHIGITAIEGMVQLQGIDIPLYEPDRVDRPQLQFPTKQGVLAAQLRSPRSDDVLRVRVNGTVYGVDL